MVEIGALPWERRRRKIQQVPDPKACEWLYQELNAPTGLLAHVRAVAALAARVAQAIDSKGVSVDVGLVQAGALLHDIGRSLTQGLDHAGVGADLLRRHGLPEPLCLVVERHTGGGIDLEEAKALGLPPKDYTPQTLEEKLVCHIDNLFNGAQRQRLADELAWLRSQGLEAAARKVAALHQELSGILGVDLDAFR